MTIENKYTDLINKFPELISRKVSLKNHTSFKIGGDADLFCQVSDKNDLISVLKEVNLLNIPYILVGSGSNILASSDGYRGLIIKFTSQEKPKVEFPYLTASAGLTLRELLIFAGENSLSGLENFAGIPGTLGGAVYMNAGAYGSSISEILVSAEIINDNYEIETVSPDFFEFEYRNSKIQKEHSIVISIKVKIKKGQQADIEGEYSRIIGIRNSKHPAKDLPCAGSYFKNLPPENPGERRRASGLFLEQAGAKELVSGGAKVYSKHANIIVNNENATSDDVLKLANEMKIKVKEKFNIKLVPEVRYLHPNKGIIKNKS